MEQPKKLRLTDEEIKAKLREGARRRHPWRRNVVLATLLFIGLPLGLLAWWLWPRPVPPHALVVAPDVFTLPGAKTSLTAWLVRDPGEDPGAKLAGWPIHFSVGAPGSGAVGEPRTETTRAGGSAELVLTAPASAGVQLFKAGYTAHRYYPGEDTGRLFVVQPEKSLLLVDLALDIGKHDLTKWQGTNIHDIPLDRETGEALVQAASKGQTIVYLACADPPTYRKMRGWLHLHANRSRLPDGPVLGCGLSAGKQPELELAQLAQQIKSRFRGRCAIISTQPRLTARYLQAGLTVFEIPGPLDPSPGVIPVKTWSELAAKLL